MHPARPHRTAAIAPAALPEDLPPVADLPPSEQLAFEALAVPVAWLDAQGRLLGANTAFERSTGLAAARCRQQALAPLLGLAQWPDDAAAAFQLHRPGGPPLAGHISLRPHRGLQIATLLITAPPGVHTNAGPTAWAPAPQATPPEARQAATAPTTGAAPVPGALLALATAAAGVGAWSLRAAVPCNPQDVHWDDQMRHLHGLALDAPAPTRAEYLAHWVHPDDRAAVNEGLDTLLKRQDGLLDLDLRVRLPGGRWRRLASRTAVHRDQGERLLHGVMLDVTERHHTEDRLRQARERALLATRGAGIGTWESDGLSGEGWWDEQMFLLRGRQPHPGPVTLDELLGCLHPDDVDAHRERLQHSLRNETPMTSEFRVVWPDGTVRWLAARSTQVRDEQGRSIGRLGINWDITEVRDAAMARTERLLARRESQAKSRFLARISHELRTPLNAVLGFSQLLLAPGAESDPATWRQQVQHVQAAGEHLLALIDDVLELSSLESGELPLSLQPVALAPLVHTSLPLVALMAQAHQVSLQLGALDGWAQADPVRLRQVLLNLLSNAIKYNRPGGSVHISAERSDGWLLLRVQDTGRGLTPDQVSHLFEPFNRLGLEGEGIAGTGIGLAIVQASVRHMGGTVQVRSQPGEGSCFEVGLQATGAPGPSALAPQAQSPTVALASGGGRLLYIEDNEVNLMIVSELVKSRRDIEFCAAENGGQGLAAARSQQPGLILLDMQLPDMSGHEVLRALRADPATAGIRCIALSANAMPDDIRAARAAGFDDYWTKPLDLKAFMRSMDLLFGPQPGVLAAGAALSPPGPAPAASV